MTYMYVCFLTRKDFTLLYCVRNIFVVRMLVLLQFAEEGSWTEGPLCPCRLHVGNLPQVE